MTPCPHCKGTGIAEDTTHKYQCEWCLGSKQLRPARLKEYLKYTEYLDLYDDYT